MKRLLLLLLLAAPVQAERLEAIPFLRGHFDLYDAHIRGDLQNHLAAEAPPIKYQVETINKNPAPSYNFGAAPAPSGSDTLSNLVNAIQAQQKAESGTKTSPFNNSFMPGVE